MKYLKKYKIFESKEFKIDKNIYDDEIVYTLVKDNTNIGSMTICEDIPKRFGKVPIGSLFLSVIQVDNIGKSLGKMLLKHSLKDIGYKYLYFNSAEILSSKQKGIEVWSHPYWDKVADVVDLYKRKSNLSDKFIYETLYRLSDTKIKNL
jgi:hypothetical protein